MEVRGIADVADQSGVPACGGVDRELVAEASEETFAGVASDDDLVGDRLVHGLTIWHGRVVRLRLPHDLTRVRSCVADRLGTARS